MTGFVEVAPGVLVLRYPVLDVNSTLVVGDGAALVVDTLSTDAQAAELADAVRRVTPHPFSIVNTHHHFDHCYGNAVLAGAAGATAANGPDIWAHEAAILELTERAAHWQHRWYDEWLPAEPELAAGIATVRVLAPNRSVPAHTRLDVGGRPVDLYHFGRGHTAGDLVVHVPDADCLIMGDLLEQGAPPAFEDAYPLEWPEALAEAHHRLGDVPVVVPGHGAVVDNAFARAQHAELTELAWLIRTAHRDGAPAEEVAARAPCGPRAGMIAARRGYAALDGRV